MDKKLKYYDLMEDLRKQIVSGKIKPGEKLPSENELSGTYQVSRQTVRKASADSSERGIYLCGTWTWNVLFGDGETHG